VAVRIGVHPAQAPEVQVTPPADSDRLPPDPFPKSILLGAATLMGLALTFAMFGNPERSNDPAVLRPAVTEQHAVRFNDNADGSISVLDGASRAELHKLAPETNGFLRVVMRSLARERRIAGLGPEEPFLLYRASTDKRLILEDPTSGRTVGLDAFGPSNVGAFAALLVTK
jgi:putative photosynthetic complex assembly protein